MRTIDDDLHAAQIEIVRKRTLAEFNIAPGRIGNASRPAEFRRSHASDRSLLDAGLDLRLQGVVEFRSLRREELDPVIVIGVMRRRNDDPGLQAQGTGQVSHRRCRHRPDQTDIDPGRRKPRLKRRLQHIAGNPRIFTDQHGWALTGLEMAARRFVGQQHSPRRIAEAHHKIRGNRELPYAPADAIGSEIFPAHPDSPAASIDLAKSLSLY